jgi:precorrin-2/cobalt-factor-2 C20-methyltransferase
MTAPQPGRLIGVGTGPGAPDLLTLRAVQVIRSGATLAYLVPEGAAPLARAIAAPHIPPGTPELAIAMPMATARAPGQAAYDAGAARIAAILDQGRDVAFLCEGDPLFYGSFMYLAARLTAYPTEAVPGVTSVSAAAAAARLPLTARNEALTILPGPLPDPDLTGALAAPGTLVILKVGRHLGRLRSLVAAAGLIDRALWIARATMAGEEIRPLAEAPDPAPYFSLILIRKGDDPWL